MSLFQNSVINKYLKNLDAAQINEAWEKFTAHFHNSAIQENIRNSKEEQYQGEFLIDLFVKVLGYVKNPTPDFNLTTELKNVKGAKKTDGAILHQEKALAVIELKGTNTTDLSKIETQAFGYKNNQPGCVYVITSNFEKLRFYIDNAVDYEEFNLFQLTKERFELLWLCLSADYLLKNVPKQIKDESLTQEENVTKKLYKDYSAFRNEIFDNIQNNNPQYDKLTLFKKTQKLLDRFLFIFFAEDRLLLPPNSIRVIVDQWTDLRDKYDEYQPLYDRFKKYFGYMNTGFKGQKYDVFAYNGGLFEPDDILDNIKIADDLLFKHTINLSKYDFESEVSVNILGHIFEHSLNEIEEIQAELAGTATEKGNSKRKKDGVFYTPKYITKYIVDNTVGQLCEEKKTELHIQEADYEKDRKGRKKATLKALLQQLEDYRHWLLNLTICDPACGSGAFLNQALEFLIREHRYIDELQAKLLGEAIVLSEVENAILENNLFGVDINEESVEIAKLSLWLRTAQKGRKLTSLNHNIKCGNSLIDDPQVAGDKAFDWKKEFPRVFEQGGFDVVVGNPPYVICQPSNTIEKTLNFYKKYEVASYKIDLFHLFFENSIINLKDKGMLGFITPNTYLTNKYIKPLRNFILQNTSIQKLIDHNEVVFIEASVDVASIILQKGYKLNNNIEILEFDSTTNCKIVSIKSQKDWEVDNENIFNIKKELDFTFIDCIPLVKICSSYFGIQAHDRKSSLNDSKLNNNFIHVIDGGDIFRYEYAVPKKYFHFIDSNIKSGGDYNVYKEERIVIRQIGKTPIVGLVKGDIVASNTLYNINLINENYHLKYVLSILNSKLIKIYWQSRYSDNKQLFPKIKGYQLKEIPIKNTSKSQQIPFVEKTDKILIQIDNLNNIVTQFINLIQSKFTLEKPSKNLQNWHQLSFGDFLKELKKAKISLSLSEEAEWMPYFNEQKAKAQKLQNEIAATDAEIDQMVYGLYGLTAEEMKVVEAG